LYVVALIAQILIYDAWNLVTPQAIMQRWIATMILLAVTGLVWYLSKAKVTGNTAYKLQIFALILTDIAVASFSVYTQRGMASRAVALYAIPIIVSAVLLTRIALFATAVLCVAAYLATTVSYFVLNFNEGYKIELYGEVGFYCISFLILASLLWIIIRSRKNS